MGWITKRRVAGFTVAGAGLLVAREFISWVFGRVIDWVVSDVTAEGLLRLPWVDILGFSGIVVGLLVAFWPKREGESYDLYITCLTVMNAFRDDVGSGHHLKPPTFYKTAKKGESALITLKKAGFSVPVLHTDRVTAAKQSHAFCQRISELLKNGHLREARLCAKRQIKEIEKMDEQQG